MMPTPNSASSKNTIRTKLAWFLLSASLLVLSVPANAQQASKQFGLTIPPNVLARADKVIKGFRPAESFAFCARRYALGYYSPG